jgi:hypothetical protein
MFLMMSAPINYAVSIRGTLNLMRAPSNRRLHLDLLFLLAEVAAAEETGSYPADDDEDEKDEHYYPFVVG